jgi:hypothetical protein
MFRNRVSNHIPNEGEGEIPHVFGRSEALRRYLLGLPGTCLGTTLSRCPYARGDYSVYSVKGRIDRRRCIPGGGSNGRGVHAGAASVAD